MIDISIPKELCYKNKKPTTKVIPKSKFRKYIPSQKMHRRKKMNAIKKKFQVPIPSRLQINRSVLYSYWFFGRIGLKYGQIICSIFVQKRDQGRYPHIDSNPGCEVTSGGRNQCFTADYYVSKLKHTFHRILADSMPRKLVDRAGEEIIN